MKLQDTTGYVWIMIDEYNDIVTEFFYPEERINTMPNQAEKWLMYHPEHKPKRLKILPVSIGE